MFTGIVEELGSVREITRKESTLELTLQAEKVTQGIKLGDSISVNGVCLTVTHQLNNRFSMDVMPETFHHTSLKMLQSQSTVNLERALHANGRFGGHFVTGHVDGIGTILKKTAEENAIAIEISVPKYVKKFLMLKGSVAVDGVSLTVFGTSTDTLKISIIPHTANETVLGSKAAGDVVNLEADMLAKYLYGFVYPKEAEAVSNISKQFLSDNGF